jgi:XTP/dITP diphosphohydrolase/ATP diphosphatase
MSGPAPQAPSLEEAIRIMARLRAPNGCPWDREQTFDSIKRHTLEETYEVFDAIDRRAWPDLKDELGDLLLQVLFYAQMAAEAGYFTLEDVAANLNAKLIRRHPHIFADATAHDAAAVNANWEAIKKTERAAKPPVSWIDHVPQHLPALLEAHKLGARAARVGFDWPDSSGLFAKLAEESAELQAEVAAGNQENLAAELGDLLFTAVNLARHLQVEPEFALRHANRKFRARFNAMEQAAGSPRILEQSTPEQLDLFWRAAKDATSSPPASPAAAAPLPGSSSPGSE